MKTFNGGIQLSCSKLTRANKIKPSFIPTKLIIPLLQNIGSTAKPVVKPGDTVLKGQVIAESESYVSSKVHAPTSGKILKIDYHPNPVYKKTQSLFLESDGEDKLLDSIKSKNTDLSMDREKIINIVQNNGIVGLGGAAFPTHVKLKAAQADKQYYLIYFQVALGNLHHVHQTFYQLC